MSGHIFPAHHPAASDWNVQEYWNVGTASSYSMVKYQNTRWHINPLVVPDRISCTL